MTASSPSRWRLASADDRLADMVAPGARTGDLRVPRRDWVHYVTWVPRRHRLKGPWSDQPGQGGGGGGVPDISGVGDDLIGGLLALAVLVPLSWAVGRFRRRRSARERAARRRVRERTGPLTVGVVRIPNPQGWKVDRPQVVAHVDLLAGTEPWATMDELAERAAAGEFDHAG